MDKDERNELLAEELLIVRHSGEIPEVALHGSIYFLTEDPAGPGIKLEEKERLELKQMVVERYREIIHRDLNPDNRDKSLYRGLARCIDNWQRLDKFCKREKIVHDQIREETRKALIYFLSNEVRAVEEKCRCSTVNCTIDDLECFIELIELGFENLPDGWKKLCIGSEK
jgi:hypothetical protein